jgi:hypothetical protein
MPSLTSKRVISLASSSTPRVTVAVAVFVAVAVGEFVAVLVAVFVAVLVAVLVLVLVAVFVAVAVAVMVGVIVEVFVAVLVAVAVAVLVAVFVAVSAWAHASDPKRDIAKIMSPKTRIFFIESPPFDLIVGAGEPGTQLKNEARAQKLRPVTCPGSPRSSGPCTEARRRCWGRG